jgi:hypothetical protein
LEIKDSDARSLFTFTDFPEMNDLNEDTATSHVFLRLSTDPLVNKRFHFVPSAKLLVTIPRTGGRLFVRHLDIEGLIKALSRFENPSPTRGQSPPASIVASMTSPPRATAADQFAAQPPAPASGAVTKAPNAMSLAKATVKPELPQEPVDRVILALVGLAALAILLWVSLYILNLRSRNRPEGQEAKPSALREKPRVSFVRRAISIVLLVLLGGLAFTELKTYRDMSSAVRLVDARFHDATRNPPNRVEVETILGRPPLGTEVISYRGSRQIKATYRWFSILRTHTVIAHYRQDLDQTLADFTSELEKGTARD